MKRLSIAAIVTISAILFSACAHTDNPSMASTPQMPDKAEISPQASPPGERDIAKSPAPSPIISAGLTTEAPSPVPSPTISPELTTEDLKHYLNMKMSEVMETFGEKDIGASMVTESHLPLPCIFVESIGLSFLFPNDFDDLRPTYIEVGGEFFRNNVSIKGARPGMNFSEIMDKLDGQVSETWIANEEIIYYQIVYKEDGLEYQFVSHDEEGTYTWLYISRDY
jgi:hypothetical protein